jgi:hypothetical protein
MVFTINSGYNKKCKNGLGGLNEIYLFPYVSYSRSNIITNANILTTFPNTTIYKFYSNGNPIANEQQETDAGGKFYSQSINLDLQYSGDPFELTKLIKKDYRIIFKDRNGLYRIFGLYKGIEADKIDYNTGSSKADFNGFKIGFIGKEEKQSFFITDLEDAGFFIDDLDYRLLEDGGYRLTENNKFRILE